MRRRSTIDLGLPLAANARKSLRLADLALGLVGGVCCLITTPTFACPAPVAVALADVVKACRDPSCGSAVSVEKPKSGTSAAIPAGCPAPGWDGLLAAIDTTLAQRGFVLLGEIHDNDTHHALRAAIIARGNSAAAASAGTATVPTSRAPNLPEPNLPDPVVFEQLTADQQSALAPYATRPVANAGPREIGAFLTAADWDNSAWSKTGNYKPLFEAALASGRAIVPGDPGRKEMMRSAREGVEGIPLGDRARLQLDTPLGAALDEASLIEIEAAHCGMMPKSALGGMAFAQRFRDAHLARATIDAAGETGGAILIAGNGHVRTDRGVPWYLSRLAPGRPVLAVLFNEATDRSTTDQNPADGVAANPIVANWVVLTPTNAERDADPCAAMKAAFERLKAPKKPE